MTGLGQEHVHLLESKVCLELRQVVTVAHGSKLVSISQLEVTEKTLSL